MLRRSARNVKRSTSNLVTSNSSQIRERFKKQTESNSTGFTSSVSEGKQIQSKNKSPKNKKVSLHKVYRITDTSSSGSDIENYLEPIEKIDLNSPFFNINHCKEEVPCFYEIDKKKFSDVTRLSDSDTSEDEGVANPIELLNIAENSRDAVIHDKDGEMKTLFKDEESIVQLNFQQLQTYHKKIEEAKKSIELYNSKQAQGHIEEIQISTNNIHGLLAAGEAKQIGNRSQPSIEYPGSNSSNTEPYTDSEQDDWEEIKEGHDERVVPKKKLEITVEMPTAIKKKKGNDLLSAVKRRLNRMKKKNQVLIHKVHLLCWIAHGNYVNSVLNDESMMALGLSLIPSEKCYPAGRTSLDYLEQILRWYKRTVKIIEKVQLKSISLNELLIEQIDKKEAYSKTMLVLIFIIILRSLGIQCRLVLSLQVEPSRPPGNDLHYLGSSSHSKRKSKRGQCSKYSKISSKENLQIGMKKIHEVFHHLKLDESVSEKSRQDCLVAKNVVNVERLKFNISSTASNHETYEAIEDESSNENPIFALEKSSGGAAGYKKKNDFDNKHQNCSKHTNDRKSEYEKHEVKNLKGLLSTRGKLQIITKSNGKKGKEVKEKRRPEKNSNQKQQLETRGSRKMKMLKVNETKGSENTKTHVVLQEIVRRSRIQSKTPAIDSEKIIRSKSVSVTSLHLEKKTRDVMETRSKSSSSTTKNKKTLEKKRIGQLDGSDDNLEGFKGFEESAISNKMLRNASFENFYSQMYCQISEGVKTRNSLKILQLDGTGDEPSTPNPNLKMLKESSKPNDGNCNARSHIKTTRKPNYSKESTSDSDDCFTESPIKKFKVIDGGKLVDLTRSKSAEKNFWSSETSYSVTDKGSANLKKLIHLEEYKVDFEKKTSLKAVDVTKDIIQLMEGRITEQKQFNKNKRFKKRKLIEYEDESDDSDYVPESTKKKYRSVSDDEFDPKLKVKKSIQIHKEVKVVKKLKKLKKMDSRKVISSDTEYTEEEIESKDMKQLKAESIKIKKGSDVWLEVFLETEEKWISVDVTFGQVHCDNELYSRATHPVSYVLSWNNESQLKDITKRYCQNYNTVTRKLRIDNQWWDESLKPFSGPNNARDREEDDELNRQQLEKPLPTTISEYKNHPLYVLERHILKFEALYPKNAPPLGFVRNEPVYSRDCVHICHSRDIWLKQAKVVKLGEKPYKIVKARPKYDKLSNTIITDQTLEIFGPWQIADYDPPTAENSVVPRNAFGNVDLFKPYMLPKKCVHLQLPGLNKIARKMNIDCASAIVGFDFHGGWSHPVYDGFVVCEEYEDQLVAAWNLEQEEIDRKEQEKYEQRVYGNWKKLIRGLIIRERLKAKYGFGEMKQEIATSSCSA